MDLDFSNVSPYDIYSISVPTNSTTSYGVLFLASLLSASSITALSGSTVLGYGTENLADATFNTRDPTLGLNADFMTYAMYRRASKNATALLDASTLASLAQDTFSTFFQHFVSSNLSLDAGGSWGYQTLDARLPADLLPPMDASAAVNASYAAALAAPDTNRSSAAVVRVATPVQVLRMDRVAVALSVGILLFLGAVAVVVGVLRWTYFVGVDGGFD
ncbi:hypothetical protein UCDDS831_g06277 [Diplodia seriata]|uniref:Uncharacterized protein n=1 Tax=Diplodia seriata TaxID=420778 RepID=A0A0G2GL70_9PEZI|nr:hypothetical protein UCDDS831_g06277 [Diplodia seriata]